MTLQTANDVSSQFVDHGFPSRASALALSAVLRTTSLSMGTYHLQVPAEQKSLNRSFCNFAHLMTSVRPLNLPKIVTIRWLGAAPHIGEI
jgi:hypothetical protein